jgi:hypothetical protein
MNPPNPQRKEISQFLAETGSEYWGVIEIRSVQLGYLEAILDVGMGVMGRWKYLRIFAHEAIDYAIRPKDPATIEGGPQMKFSTDDPRLNDPGLQTVPGGDGEMFNPPNRYQLLELDQSWIIAVRFEVEVFEPAPIRSKAT